MKRSALFATCVLILACDPASVRDDFDVEYVVGYEISSRGPDAAGVTDRQSNPSVGPSDVLAFRITLP